MRCETHTRSSGRGALSRPAPAKSAIFGSARGAPSLRSRRLQPAALCLCAKRLTGLVLQDWWDEHKDLKAGTDGKLISACSGCSGVFCAKECCAATTCSECALISCKQCDKSYVCGDCGDAWCVRCRDRMRCADCNFQQCSNCWDGEGWFACEEAGCNELLCEGCGFFHEACDKLLCLGCTKICATCGEAMLTILATQQVNGNSTKSVLTP